MTSNGNNTAYNFKTDKAHNLHKTDTSSAEGTDNTEEQSKSPKKKITIEVDEDDPCLKRDDGDKGDNFFVPGHDPRFQQQNQSLRCWVMYTDFYRCERILGEGADACTWFKQVFTSICPNEWIRNWDDLRLENKFAWQKYKTQGEFPGDRYGD